MEKTIRIKKCTYESVFKELGAGNYVHLSLKEFDKDAVNTERTRQNKYANCAPMNEKFAISTTIKKGYITIYQRY